MNDPYLHTRRLAQFLEMDSMGKSELKKTAEKIVPRELSYHDFDGKVVNARELLISEGVQGTTLIPTEIYATVIEGSEPAKCIRNALPIYRMAGANMTVPVGETGTYAPVVAEGAEIPIEDQTHTGITLAAKKYAVRPLITNEMVEDALYDIVANEIRKSGARIENALNHLGIEELMYESDTESDCGSAGATPFLFIAKGHAKVVAAGFQPNVIIFEPTCYGSVAGTMTTQSNMMSDLVSRNGIFGNVLGCATYMYGGAAVRTHTWGFSADGYVGAIIMDRNCAAIGMRRDITVERYADSIKQMQGVSVSARFDVKSLVGEGICNVIY